MLIAIKENLRDLLEKRSQYRFRGKEQDRSNYAAGKADRGSAAAFCPRQHDTIAYSGPPHDSVKQYVCMHCSAGANEAMIKDMGFEFDTVPDYVMADLMDEVLRVRASGKKMYFPTN